MQVEIVTKQRVIEQEIGGKSMEDYMSEKLIEIEWHFTTQHQWLGPQFFGPPIRCGDR